MVELFFCCTGTEAQITSCASKMNAEATDKFGGQARSALRKTELGHVYISLREMWEIYIKAVKSTDKSADNIKVCSR